MASKQLQDLKLSEEQAEEIIELGVSLGAVDADDMPESKKDKIQAATEVVAHSLDAWIEDEIRPTDDEADVAEAGETIEKIFAISGVSVDDDNEVTVAGAPADNGGDDDDDAGEGDETPFDPDDYIAGYSEMSVVAKVAKVKKLDPSNDDDAAVLEALYEWENEQEKPSSRVLNVIDEKMPQDGDTDETADEAGDAPEAEADEDGGEPWEGYDKLSATDIKKVLGEAAKDEEDPLTIDQVEYVLEYEESREKPAPRKRVIDFCNALLNEMRGEGDKGGDEEPAAEPEAEAPKRGRARKAEPASTNGKIVLTRDDILMALANGEVEIEV